MSFIATTPRKRGKKHSGSRSHFISHVSRHNDDKVEKIRDYLDILEMLTSTAICILNAGELRASCLVMKTPEDRCVLLSSCKIVMGGGYIKMNL